MAHSAFPVGIPAAAPSVVRSPSDLVGRAAAILAGETRAYRPALGAAEPARSLVEAAALMVPWRQPTTASAAGTAASIPLRVASQENGPVQIVLYASDLLSDNGRSIPSFAVSFEPETLNVGAGQQAVVTARVEIPPQSVPGAYSGLVQAVGLPGVKAVITVEVT